MPQARAEPGVQRILILYEVDAFAGAALFWLSYRSNGLTLFSASLRQYHTGIWWPPQLARDAPVADVVHPVEVHFVEAFGDDLDFSRLHRGNGRLGQGLHGHEPLLGEQWLQDSAATIAAWRV